MKLDKDTQIGTGVAPNLSGDADAVFLRTPMTPSNDDLQMTLVVFDRRMNESSRWLMTIVPSEDRQDDYVLYTLLDRWPFDEAEYRDMVNDDTHTWVQIL